MGHPGDVSQLVAGVIGDARTFVSGGAEHQGPDGGGLIAVIAERFPTSGSPSCASQLSVPAWPAALWRAPCRGSAEPTQNTWTASMSRKQKTAPHRHRLRW